MSLGDRSPASADEPWRTLRATTSVTSPAKINLHLRVHPLAGGYHPLRSWFRTIKLADELHFEQIESDESRDGTIDIACNTADVPLGEDNLVARAWHRLGGEHRGPMRVTINKRIPLGGGLGGGSSNAAATLHALAALWDGSSSIDDAAALGSDVPFFHEALRSGLADATVTGRGENVAPFRAQRRHAVLLFLPGLHCSTPDVFRRFDAMPAPADDGEPDFADWSSLPAGSLLPRLRNDLEPPAFALYPQLAQLRDDLDDHLSRPVRMSGSGSTLFTLYDDAAKAKAAAASLPGRLRAKVKVRVA